MKLLARAAAAVLLVAKCVVQAAEPRGVFAHFMVGNTESFSTEDWANNMRQAASAGVHAFALNMAQDWGQNEAAVAMAVAAAESTGFKVLFSFDYAGGGPWSQNVVIEYINRWGPSSAYWKHDGKPLVSTFEGPDNAQDWVEIKKQTGCFFMPDWSSRGAGPASALAGGVADGLFSWAAWPWGNRKMDTYTDHSYTQALGGKPYMMAVSPWFYTNMPGYNKNWLWGGGNLWYERWQQVWDIKPTYVQIISWNDYGESHYVGPLDDRQYTAFQTGKAPFNYVKDFDHTGWLMHLPFMIQTYMSGTGSFQQESALVAHHVTPTGYCSTGGTTGNTATQLQLEFPPGEVSQDRLYIAALLAAPAALTITGAGTIQVAADKWDIMPDGGVGLYYTSVPMSGPARYTIQFSRGGAVFHQFSTVAQQDCFGGGYANWNARVSTTQWDNGNLKRQVWTQQPPLSERVCIKGWGPDNFNKVCGFACEHGYCPDACVCQNLGVQRTLPDPLYVDGFSKNGDANYAGLCSFGCNFGSCPEEACSPTEQPSYVPSTSPFNPNTCTGGTGPAGDFQTLCKMTCEYGFCPRNICTCTATGPLKLPLPPVIESIADGTFSRLTDAGLCLWACSRGTCPAMCEAARSTIPGGVFVEDEDLEEDGFDFSDFSWVKSFAAMGDSFAAGIGVGNVRPEDDAPNCSRYTGAYPLKLQQAIQAETFYFVACSGDTSEDILATQIAKLSQPIATATPPSHDDLKRRTAENDHHELAPRETRATFDLISMSAGGNDVGFSDVLKDCLLLPGSLDKCATALVKAEGLIDNNLASNIASLLTAIEPSLNDKGVLVWTLYTPFFDLAPLPCNEQSWCILTGGCLHPTVEIRSEFNRLVKKANSVLLATFASWNRGRSSKKVHPANWAPLVTSTQGQFCAEGGSGDYDDVSNRYLAFIRFNVGKNPEGGFVPTKRDIFPFQPALNSSDIPKWKLITPEEMDQYHQNALRTLSPRSRRRKAEMIPEWVSKRDTSGLIPDSLLQNFHPNELGTTYQASSALHVIIQAREEIMGIDEDALDDSCPWTPPTPTPTKTATPTPTPTPTPKGYESGRCCFHMYQYESCDSDDWNYRCQLTLFDNTGRAINRDYQTHMCGGSGWFTVDSPLENSLSAVGVHDGDYVQFTTGSLIFKSNDKNYCSEGGWDPRKKSCGSNWVQGATVRTRQMDCCFPCA